jgi:4-amino-4-deoxy-L-arabinose transferase-like glycosyltransferase
MGAVGRRELGVGVVALVIRLLHNSAMMGSPLYQLPLGGHVAFLDQAEAIAGGALVPVRAFTENSPLFPYLLAPIFLLAGGRDLFLARLAGMLADAVTAMLVTRLGARRFGPFAGVAAGLLYAAYGPAVFFAGEPMYVPWALLCCTATVVLLTGDRARAGRALAAGLAYGLAVGLMPSLLAGVPLFALVVATRERAARGRRVGAALAGVALAIAPLTALNYAASGKLVLLTLSSGHAFYLGHNPQARAGYYLPDRVGAVQAANRGSIFDSMQRIAAETEGRPIPDEAVSGYYFRKAWEHVRAEPMRELGLAGSRVAAFCNWYEATTYADFYFQRERSPLLRFLPAFPVLLALAAVGLARSSPRRELPLLLFPLTSLATVLGFFFLARFRMPAVPFLCCFAGHAVAELAAAVRGRRPRALLGAGAVAAVALAVASRTMVVPDTSNEWNKVGAVHLALEQYPDAQHAFERAAAANPGSPYPYLNLGRVYDATGAPDRAREARATANAIMAGQADGDRFRRQLTD